MADLYTDNDADLATVRDAVGLTSVRALRHTKKKTLRHAGFRSGLPTIRVPALLLAGGRYWDASHVDIKAGDTIYVGVANGAIQTGAGESANGGVLTARMAIQFGATRSADFTANIADGAVGEVAVVVPVDIPAFHRFTMHVDFSLSAGGFAYANFSNNCDRGNGDQWATGAGGYGHTQDSTVLGASTAEVGMWLPVYTKIMSDKVVRVAWGDSLTQGVSDISFDPSGGKGIFGRALAADGPFLNLGAGGDQASLVAALNTMRSAIMVGAGASADCPMAGFIDLGTNDLFSGIRSATQLVGDIATCVAAMKAAGCDVVSVATILPRTLSTDFFATTANQTSQSAVIEVKRCAYNDYWRGVTFYTTKGTLTNGSAIVTLATNLALYGLYPGMTITSGTSGIPGATTISSIDHGAGTITMSAAFTGTTTANANVTGTTPSVSGTKSADAVVDLAYMIEGSKTRAAGAIRNGGVFLPGLVSDDGTHLTSLGYAALEPVVSRAMLSLG